MKDLNLVLMFRLSGDGQMRVKGVSRIKLDGRGGLMVYDSENGAAETYDLQKMQSFSIQPLNANYLPAA
jgi:hypothetical protein